MTSRAHKGILAWLRRCFTRRPGEPPELLQAKALISAVDRGGIPLNPVRVNAIARGLGLEVSRKAAVEETIERIRAALIRAG